MPAFDPAAERGSGSQAQPRLLPAGFGMTTLLSEWVADCGSGVRVAWLSLNKGNDDLVRFLAYLVAALQTVEGNMGQGMLPIGTQVMGRWWDEAMTLRIGYAYERVTPWHRRHPVLSL